MRQNIAAFSFRSFRQIFMPLSSSGKTSLAESHALPTSRPTKADFVTPVTDVTRTYYKCGAEVRAFDQSHRAGFPITASRKAPIKRPNRCDGNRKPAENPRTPTYGFYLSDAARRIYGTRRSITFPKKRKICRKRFPRQRGACNTSAKLIASTILVLKTGIFVYNSIAVFIQ
jgi:hypothetical protein